MFRTIRATPTRVAIVEVSGFARVVFRTDNAGQRIESNAAGEVTGRPKHGAPGGATLRVLPARARHKAPRVGP
jgi:hypothetical protein